MCHNDDPALKIILHVLHNSQPSKETLLNILDMWQ